MLHCGIQLGQCRRERSKAASDCWTRCGQDRLDSPARRHELPLGLVRQQAQPLRRQLADEKIDAGRVAARRKSPQRGGNKMPLYGYARVSTRDQDLASQDAELRAAGCTKVFKEKVSGVRTDRPELAKILRRLEPGDVLMVTRLDRLARSTRDLLNLLAAVTDAALASRASRMRGATPRRHTAGC